MPVIPQYVNGFFFLSNSVCIHIEQPSKHLKGNPAVKDKYDWIVILGGTNDLGFGLKPDVIFAGLKKIYEIARDHGANVLAITIPECAVINKSLDGRRDELNTLIKDYNGGQL